MMCPLLLVSPLLEVVQAALDVLFIRWLPLRVPPTECGSSFDDVAGGPFNSQTIQILGEQEMCVRTLRGTRFECDMGRYIVSYLAGLVVRAQDVESALLDLLEHEMNGVFGSRSTSGLLSQTVCCLGTRELGIYPSRAIVTIHDQRTEQTNKKWSELTRRDAP